MCFCYFYAAAVITSLVVSSVEVCSLLIKKIFLKRLEAVNSQVNSKLLSTQ